MFVDSKSAWRRVLSLGGSDILLKSEDHRTCTKYAFSMPYSNQNDDGFKTASSMKELFSRNPDFIVTDFADRMMYPDCEKGPIRLDSPLGDAVQAEGGIYCALSYESVRKNVKLPGRDLSYDSILSLGELHESVEFLFQNPFFGIGRRCVGVRCRIEPI
jgi:hypothetical protein